MSATEEIPKFLRIREAAALLRCSPSTIYRHQHDNPDFPKIRRICGHSLLRLDEIQKFLEAQK